MIKKNNQTEELEKKLTSEGKVSYLNEPHHIEAIIRMNEEMEEVRRDFKIKDENSQASAATLILTSWLFYFYTKLKYYNITKDSIFGPTPRETAAFLFSPQM